MPEIEKQPWIFDYLTSGGRQHIQEHKISLHYQQAWQAFKNGLASKQESIRGLEIGKHLELKDQKKEQYHQTHPGSWRSHIVADIERIQEHELVISVQQFYDCLDTYRTGDWRRPSYSYHSISHEQHILRMGEDLEILSIDSDKKSKTEAHFIMDPWKDEENLASSKPVIEKEQQAEVLERVASLLTAI